MGGALVLGNSPCLVAIDPGACAGWSVWRIVKGMGATLGMGATMEACGLGCPPHVSPTPAAVVVEIPKVYKEQRKPVPPQDLVTLGFDAGRHIERATGMYGKPPNGYGVFPATWKKQVDKEKHHRWLKSQMESLDPRGLARALETEKQYAKSYRHNMWDAVALGHWACPRLELIHTFSDYVFTPLVEAW